MLGLLVVKEKFVRFDGCEGEVWGVDNIREIKQE